MMTRLLALAVVASLVAGAPGPAFATAQFEFFRLAVGDNSVELVPPAIPSPPTTVGNKTSVNVAGSYEGGGYSFTIGPSPSTAIPIVFGVDSTLDQIGFTGAVITYKGGPTTDVTLGIDYSFDFDSVTAATQTYGVQMAGAFKRGTGTAAATGDSVTMTSSVVFFAQEFGNQIDGILSFTVATVNTFVPPRPPSGSAVIPCGATVCTSHSLDTLVKLHFAQPGDSVAIPNSFITVSADGDDADAAAAVQAFLDAEAAADAAALPEPDTIVLLLGSGLAWLGLFRLKQVRGRARRDQRD